MNHKNLFKSFITFSIKENRNLKIKYKKQDYTEYRNIKPIELKIAKNGNIILLAFDRNKLGWRCFSLDKIKYVKIKEDYKLITNNSKM